MKNRAFLPLIEQIVMIVVFAIISAVCLKGFAVARSISVETERIDNAVILAQNTAEMLKLKKHLEAKTITYYDKDLKQTDECSEYTVVATSIENEDPLLGEATVQVFYSENLLFELTVGWQEDFNE